MEASLPVGSQLGLSFQGTASVSVSSAIACGSTA
jgi:hypothetical protein